MEQRHGSVARTHNLGIWLMAAAARAAAPSMGSYLTPKFGLAEKTWAIWDSNKPAVCR